MSAHAAHVELTALDRALDAHHESEPARRAYCACATIPIVLRQLAREWSADGALPALREHVPAVLQHAEQLEQLFAGAVAEAAEAAP